MNKLTVSLSLIATSIILSSTAVAKQLDAVTIVAKVNAVDEGEYVSRKLLMTMTDKRGKSRQRDTISYRKYYADEKRTVLFYLQPKNVKGTGFLTYDYADKARDDDQWLYLPAMRKVRRISAADRGDYFLGTDLTYEDMKLEGKLEPADFVYSVIGQKQQQGKTLIQLAGVPHNQQIAAELGYSKVQFWVDSSNWIVVATQAWDLRGKLLKSITNSDIRRVDGIWTRHLIEVLNHKTGHQTVYQFSEVNYKTLVKDSLFRKNALSRGR